MQTHVLVVVRHMVGGIRTYLKYTYGALDPIKYRFTVITVASLESGCVAEDLKRFSVELKQLERKRPERKLFNEIRRAANSRRFDLIHSHGLTAGLVAAAANLRLGLPHIVTSHDVFRPDQFRGAFGGFKRFMLQSLLRTVDRIQSVTFAAERNLFHYLPRLDSSKSAVIPNGIPISLFRSDRTGSRRLRRDLQIGEEAFLFAFVGRFMPQKGFDFIIDAVERLSKSGVESAFRVVAVNDGSFISEYKERIKEKGIENYFVFMGFRSDLHEILPEFDAVLMPSLWEACGLVAMEALVTGCPLIASESDGLKEVLNGTPAMRVPPKDGPALARAMTAAMSNRESIKKAAESYAPQARLRFDVERTAKALDELIQASLSANDDEERVPKESDLDKSSLRPKPIKTTP